MDLPSQTADKIKDFHLNLEKLLSQIKPIPPFIVKLANFNARSKSWWSKDITTNK